MTATVDNAIADLRRANAELRRQLDEALQRETATAEVLGVINSSPTDLEAVFDAMLERALRLCEAAFGVLWRYDGERFYAAGLRGVSAAFAEALRTPIHSEPGAALYRLEHGERLAHFSDVMAEAAYRSGPGRALVELGGARTLLAVPLRKDDHSLLGAFATFRQEVRPFSDKQIALLENFATQAVIAIENARLITETREALEQQTATAEVLQVINSSPGDLAPVFSAILEKAARLCEAAFGVLWTHEGEAFRAAALRGVPPAYAEFVTRQPRGSRPGGALGRLALGETMVHVPDTSIDGQKDPVARTLVELGGIRTLLAVSLRKDNELLGAFTIYRQEVRPFTDKQIALLQNFAAQAVIAMENARLISETREALEQQTATAEVLQVINASPGDLAPVFDAILEKAHSLCEAAHGVLATYDGESFRAIATRGLPDPLATLMRRPFRPLAGSPHERLLRGERVVQISDLAAETVWTADDPKRRSSLEMGIRTLLFVPLRKDDNLLGYISADRLEVRPFSEREIALLENFAAQAVIAMENARLITETREALDQQTATAEVLQVINSSPGDLAPVFDAMLDKALHLCGAAFGVLWTYSVDRFRPTAHRGVPPPYAEYLASEVPAAGPGTGRARLLAGEPFVHTVDLADEEPYRAGEPHRRAVVDLGGARTALLVPLHKDEAVIGFILIYRQEVRLFSDKQIALLQNFAAQAVIAMENARLLGEIRQREQELRVTFDNMADGVAMFDEAMQLAAWNRNFQELLQLSDEFLARPHGFDDYIRYLTERGEFGEIDPEAQIKRLRESIGEQFSFERTRPDGKVIEVRNNPMPNGGTVVIYSDITERKRSEEEIRAARDAAETAYRNLKDAQANLIQAQKMAALGQLTAGVAHEIKNPLNFVNNFAGLSVELLDELKTAAAPGFAALDDSTRAEIDETVAMLTSNLEKIAEHGQRADAIVKSMLEHSRGGSGDRRSVNLNSLIDEALNLAYHGARAQDQAFNVALERNFAVSMAPIELVPQDITRVFLNLIGNGFYAANERRKQADREGFLPTLRVATRDLGDVIEIAVRDNGVGIPTEIKDKLFQPFFTTKPTGEGTGLGLSISYDIVTQQHGGTIEVDSRVGEFTEFTVRLPRR